MKKALFSIEMIALLIMTACAPRPQISMTTAPTAISTLTSLPSPESTAISTAHSTEQPLEVVFTKNGDIQLWDSASQQSRMILKAGDVTTVMMSDDGQVIACLRRALVEQPELMENISLWVMDSNGQNSRELVSADSLRQRLNPSTTDSVGFAQINWIPHTHRLVYSASKYFLPGQGFTLSTDIYLTDADTGSDTMLAADVMPDTSSNAWHFSISPDGQQIALIASTSLSFIDIQGNNWQHAVNTYPAVGVGDGVLLPNGVWTADSSAFVFTRPMESASPLILNYKVVSVPVDGSPLQELATLSNSHSNSVTFSPSGDQMAFLRGSDWLITSLPPKLGDLAIPYGLELFYANLHWSPSGTAFVIKDQDLFQLCPGATQASEICGEPIHLGQNHMMNFIQWVDRDRFLFTGLEPSTLSLGHLDGTITPIVTWTEGESASWSFKGPNLR